MLLSTDGYLSKSNVCNDKQLNDLDELQNYDAAIQLSKCKFACVKIKSSKWRVLISKIALKMLKI